MTSETYKVVEVVGSSPISSDDAIRNAVAKAGETIHNLRWFEVTDTRGHLADGTVAHFQVTVKLGFTLDE